MEKLITIHDFKRLYQFNESDFLGQGGFSKVYKAKNLSGEWVALKFFDGKMEDRNNLQEEYQKIKHFNHPNLIDYKSFEYLESTGITGQKEQIQVAVLEYADAGSLAGLLKESPSPELVKKLLQEVFQGIRFLHEKANMVHRDITPSNILLRRKGSELQAKIADFGISRRLSEAEDRKATEVIGNSTYLAPEVFLSPNYDFKVDIWAMGIIIYEAFLHRTPYVTADGKSTRELTISKIATGPPPSKDILSAIPFPWNLVAERCLVKNPKARASAADCLQLLKNPPKATSKPKESTTQVLAAPGADLNDGKTSIIDLSEIVAEKNEKTEVISPAEIKRSIRQEAPAPPPPSPVFEPPSIPQPDPLVKPVIPPEKPKRLGLKIGIPVALLLLLSIGGYQIYRYQQFQTAMEKGEERYQDEDYFYALDYFEEAAGIYGGNEEAKEKVELAKDKTSRVTYYNGLIEEGKELESENQYALAIKTYEQARALLPGEDRGDQAGSRANEARDHLPSGEHYRHGVYANSVDFESVTAICPMKGKDYFISGYAVADNDDYQCFVAKTDGRRSQLKYAYSFNEEHRDKFFASTYVRNKGPYSVGYFGIGKGHTEGVLVKFKESVPSYEAIYRYDGSYQGWVEFKNMVYDPVHERIVMVGYAQTGSGAHKALMIQTDVNGTEKSIREFETTREGNSMILYGVQPFAYGYIACGYEEGANNERYPVVVSTDWEGNFLWRRKFDFKGQANEIARTKDGGFIVTGHRFKGRKTTQAMLLKLDGEGYREWDRIYTACGESDGLEVIEDLDGNYVVVGWRDCGEGEATAFMYKMSPEKELLTTKSLWSVFEQSSVAQALCQGEDGGYVIGGYVNWSDELRSGKVWKTDRNGRSY